MGVSKRLRFAIFQRDDFTCKYCGRSPPDVVLHCDHEFPRARGGNDHPLNLVTACSDCNSGKSDKMLMHDERALPWDLELLGLELDWEVW